MRASLDTPPARLLLRLANLFLLNILWLVCSLPVFTYGAATSALYAVTLQMTRRDAAGELPLVRTFWDAFLLGFKDATLRWSILLAAAGLLGLGALSYLGSGSLPALLFLVAGALVWFFEEAYLFPLTSQFDDTLPSALASAFLLSMQHFPRTLALVALKLLPLALFAVLGRLLPTLWFLWLAFGGAGCAHLASRLLRPVLASMGS